MNRLLLSALLLILGCSVSSAATHTGIIVGNGSISTESDCVRGNGTIRREKRSLPPFQRINISGAFNIKLHCGRDSTALLTMDENILALVQTTVVNGALSITNRKSICVDNPLQLEIATPMLSHLTADGANDVIIDCGSGYDTLDLSLSEASTVQLIGKGKQLTALLEDASELDAENNLVRKARIITRGSATAVVNASDMITAESSDASEIYYNDSVAHIQKTVTDAGDILPLSER